MPSYDDVLFNPPAPLAKVSLRNPQNGKTIQDVPMLIDTGADATLLPAKFVEQLELSEDLNKVYELQDFNSQSSFAVAVQLEMIFLEKTIRGQFLLIEQDYGFIGRNVLNVLRLKFDGPNLSWNEDQTP